MLLEIKIFVKKHYFRLIEIMHLPFIKRGADDPVHAVFGEFINLSMQPPTPPTVLEIGSRNVMGTTRRDSFQYCK